MKRILITGANSYIGMSFEKYINEHFASEFSVDTVDMIDGSWREKSFSDYDVVYHVAGIAHSDNGKINEEKAKLYYAVNTELTIETAEKTKARGLIKNEREDICLRAGLLFLHDLAADKNQLSWQSFLFHRKNLMKGA